MSKDTDDIEHLKVHKIRPDTSSHVFLPQFDRQAPPPQPPSDAEWGAGEPPAGPVDKATLHDDVIVALKTIFDPEIPVNIYDLGLIYEVHVADDARVDVKMTLTAPACPVAGMLVQEVAEKVGRVEGVSKSHVDLVWDPPWTQDLMTEAAKLELGLF